MNLQSILNQAGATCANHSPKLNLDNTHITIVKGVSKSLLPQTDFELNGTIVCSLTRDEFNKQYGKKLLEDIDDLNTKDIKLIWSVGALSQMDEKTPYNSNLVVRVTGQDPETGAVNVIALRNKYGSSLVPLPLIP